MGDNLYIAVMCEPGPDADAVKEALELGDLDLPGHYGVYTHDFHNREEHKSLVVVMTEWLRSDAKLDVLIERLESVEFLSERQVLVTTKGTHDEYPACWHVVGRKLVELTRPGLHRRYSAGNRTSYVSEV